jgi:hypothetical protein
MTHRVIQDTTLRYLETIRACPLGRETKARAVHTKLSQLGHHVTLRTVQRDLWMLARPFGIDPCGTERERTWKRTRSLEDVG